MSRADVVVSYFSLRPSPERLQALARLLTAEERARSARFATDTLRTAFIAARGQVREILAHHCRWPAADIELGVGAHGKPHLVTPVRDVHFSISHTREYGMCALSWTGAIGVDVEAMNGDIDWRGVAATVFEARELRTLESFDESDAHSCFFRLWSCKEAVMKGDGRGFSLPSDSFHVPPRVWAGASVEQATIDVEGRRWQVECGVAPPGHAAAIAREREGDRAPSYGWWPLDARGPALTFS